MNKLMSFFAVVLMGASAIAATANTEEQKIEALLNSFDAPGITFVRNGEDHDGAWAKQHLAEKLKEAKPAITTADDFIAKVGTSSSHTGKPYEVKTADGKKVESSVWFKDKLAELNKPAPASAAPSAGTPAAKE